MYESFLVCGVDFKRPSRFFKILGFTPHAMTLINSRYGGIDNWTRNKFPTLDEHDLIEHLKYLNTLGMPITKVRVCKLMKEGIKAQLERIDIGADDPVRPILQKFVDSEDLELTLKEFFKTTSTLNTH